MSLNDEDRLRLLSDAERAAMEDDNDEYDPDADNAAALAELGRGDLDADDNDDADSASGGEATDPTDPTQPTEPPAKPDAAAAAAAPAAPSDPVQPTDSPAPAPAPQAAQQASGYRVDLPADYDEQVKANKAAAGAARTKFNDGQMDQAELDAELEKLEDERDQLRDLQTRAKISAEMRQQSAQDAWVGTINTFIEDAAKNSALGIVDYRNDAGKQADLDGMVRALAAVPGNENKPMRWFLEEGHKRVVALHGIATAPAAAPAVAPAASKKPADARRTPDVSAVVTSLADVPGGAGDTDPVSDEFAELDKLQGLDYERALGRLSEDKRSQYLRST